MAHRQNEVLTQSGHADSGAALEQLQRESQELYKQYPPAKFYTKESLLEESKHLFAQGQLLPERFVLKLEPSSSVNSQVDAVVQSVRNEMEKTYPGSEPPPSNYYAIKESKDGSLYAYVGIIGGAKTSAPQPTVIKVADTIQEQKRSCLGLPSDAPDNVFF